MNMRIKAWIKSCLADAGLHGYTAASLPTGVSWLHDMRRLGLTAERPVCMDVGANVGQTVRELHGSWPGARIHAFEPFAEPFAELQALCASMANATAVPQAMGAQAAEMVVATRERSVLNSLCAAAPPTQRQPTERIRIDTLDHYCALQGLNRIDVLKTDTEGYDLEVLKGAETCLREQRVVFVYTEVTLQPGNTQNSPFVPILHHLEERGYRFLGLYETFSLHHFVEPNLFCNALFVGRTHWKPSA